SGEILNYPGIAKTDGVAFSSMFEEQLKANGIEPRTGAVITQVSRHNGSFILTSDKETYEAKSVIVATGSRPRKLEVPGEAEFANKGVTYCSICDGPLFSGQDIAVIGGGNSALEGVDFTKDIAARIFLINNEKEFRAHEILMEKARALKNLEIIDEAATRRIYGTKTVEGLVYERQGKEHDLKVHGIIVEIGRLPNTGFLEGFLKLDQTKHVVIDCQTNTSVEGVFAAGDCASGNEYQYAIAAGQGCIALLKAARYLAGRR
ncbi:MAG: NAD(P)/FAD-dependent oxidoreductase, partial [Deltaproteobacteria bacterium]